MAKCLYGTCSENVAGYCHNPEHCYAMTPHQIKVKQCRQKECKHLEKNLKHEWWAQLERQNQKRKARKERLNTMIGR